MGGLRSQTESSEIRSEENFSGGNAQNDNVDLPDNDATSSECSSEGENFDDSQVLQIHKLPTCLHYHEILISFTIIF